MPAIDPDSPRYARQRVLPGWGSIGHMQTIRIDPVTGIRPGAPNASSATITFRLYGPGDTSCTTPINGTGEVRPLVGGTAATVAGFSITQAQAGQYRWVAIYSGDQFNNPYTTACGAETHTITVQ